MKLNKKDDNYKNIEFLKKLLSYHQWEIKQNLLSEFQPTECFLNYKIDMKIYVWM